MLLLLDISENFYRFRASAALKALLAFAAIFASLPLLAQQQGALPPTPRQDEIPASPQGMTPSQSLPPQASGSTQSSSVILKESPAIPVDQIIQRFAEREAEFKTERDNFTYVQTFLVQTIDDAGHADGEYRLTTDITFTHSGQRNEVVTYAPPPTLERISLSEEDLADLRNVQPFVLTTEELPKYDISYVGRQQVDEIGTYVFDVKPKRIEKNQRYFQGRIWVDDQYLEIVKTFGKAVPDIRKSNNENVFPRFETYRENIEGHFWFPTYTRADDVLHFQSEDVHIRMTVHYSDYKRFRVTSRLLPATPLPPGRP
jgi:hypothetical protein